MYTRKRSEVRELMIIISLVFVAAILLALGVNSFKSSKERCITIKETFEQTELYNYYVKDSIECSSPAYYEWGYRLLGIIPLMNYEYYLVKPEGEDCWITIQAGSSWIEQFADVTGYAKTKVEIEGNLNELNEEAKEFIEEVKASGVIEGEINTEYYISGYSKYDKVYKIVCAVVLYLMIFVMLWERKIRRKEEYGEVVNNKEVVKVLNIILIIIMLVCIFKGNILLL